MSQVWVCVQHNVDNHDLTVYAFNGKNIAFDFAKKKASLLVKKNRGGEVTRSKTSVFYKSEEHGVTDMWDISEQSIISGVEV